MYCTCIYNYAYSTLYMCICTCIHMYVSLHNRHVHVQCTCFSTTYMYYIHVQCTCVYIYIMYVCTCIYMYNVRVYLSPGRRRCLFLGQCLQQWWVRTTVTFCSSDKPPTPTLRSREAARLPPLELCPSGEVDPVISQCNEALLRLGEGGPFNYDTRQ